MSDKDPDNFKYSDGAEQACKILPGRVRRETAATPLGDVTTDDNGRMTRAGFDKGMMLSQYFRQACGECNACLPARVVASQFVAGRSDRQVLRRNRDLTVAVNDNPDFKAHQELFRRNFRDRHEKNYNEFEGMFIRNAFNVAAMIRNPMFPNKVLEVRGPDDSLLGASVFDDTGDGLKGHYYYYEPHLPAARSMGTFMVLKMIECVQEMGKDYLYLGALTREPSKLSYKARFRPLEVRQGGNWVPFIS